MFIVSPDTMQPWGLIPEVIHFSWSFIDANKKLTKSAGDVFGFLLVFI